MRAQLGVGGRCARFVGVVGVLLAIAPAVWAQPAPLPGRAAPEFLLDRFTPAAPGSDFFALDSLDFRGAFRPALRAGFAWSQKPFTFDEGAAGHIVERQMFLHLGIGFNVAERLRLGLDLPVVLSQRGTTSPSISGIVYPAPAGETMGDVRASIDVRLFGRYGDPVTAAIGTHVFFPTVRRRYTTDAIVRVMPRLQVAGQGGAFTWALAGGFHNRDEVPDQWFQGYGIGHEVFGGAALGFVPAPGVLLGGELMAFTRIAEGKFLRKRSTPAELLFGVRFVLAEHFRVALGAGPGLTPSKGSPEVRYLARLEWFPGIAPPPDLDGDGIPDADDACPREAGPGSADPQAHGCRPPEDRDHDGVPDGEDACPDDSGVRSDNGAINGCPAPRDRDGDGVYDPADACPDNPGVRSNDARTIGCPVVDRDRDGLPDADDACPDKAGERSDEPKTNGCPDADADGVRDPDDACPTLGGRSDADATRNGCPLARLEGSQILILDQVQFRTGSAVILPESTPVLDAVARVLGEHPEVRKVRIEGHTDNRGPRAANQRVSAQRAAAVLRWLVSEGGVDRTRLVSVGVGMDRPVAGNDTEPGRQANRRVEFHVIETAPPPPAPAP